MRENFAFVQFQQRKHYNDKQFIHFISFHSVAIHCGVGFIHRFVYKLKRILTENFPIELNGMHCDDNVNQKKRRRDRVSKREREREMVALMVAYI